MKKTIMKLMFIMLLYVCMTACYEDKGNISRKRNDNG